MKKLALFFALLCGFGSVVFADAFNVYITFEKRLGELSANRFNDITDKKDSESQEAYKERVIKTIEKSCEKDEFIRCFVLFALYFEDNSIKQAKKADEIFQKITKDCKGFECVIIAKTLIGAQFFGIYKYGETIMPLLDRACNDGDSLGCIYSALIYSPAEMHSNADKNDIKVKGVQRDIKKAKSYAHKGCEISKQDCWDMCLGDEEFCKEIGLKF